MKEENFDFFEQQEIMNGTTTPAEIIEERDKEAYEEYLAEHEGKAFKCMSFEMWKSGEL